MEFDPDGGAEVISVAEPEVFMAVSGISANMCAACSESSAELMPLAA